MKKKITIIRHGQSVYNTQTHKSQDELKNCRITELGREQSSKLNHSFDILILSPLKRVIETYTNSNIKIEDIAICSLFKETYTHFILNKQNDVNFSSINSLENESLIIESIEEVKLRATQARIFIENNKYENIGIISHKNFIWYFLEACGQNPIYLNNTELITFEL